MPSEDSYFKKGSSGNPGGNHRGKRISTWLIELGQIHPANWPSSDDLPANGQIAVARLKDAMSKHGERSTEIIAELTEGKIQNVLQIISPKEKDIIDAKLAEYEKPIAPSANA